MLMKVLLSIKPQYVEKIISGEKQYEFRKKNLREKTLIQLSFIHLGM